LDNYVLEHGGVENQNHLTLRKLKNSHTSRDPSGVRIEPITSNLHNFTISWEDFCMGQMIQARSITSLLQLGVIHGTSRLG
jgi:hypothetical protein